LRFSRTATPFRFIDALENGADGSGGADLCFELGQRKVGRCYQLMETEDRALLEQGMANGSDLVDFEVETIISSKEAADKIAARL
jgi:hypothetical protein